MNYGKFFRLNQNVSKIEEGVTIFDYIDLPAYFDSSRSNKMSPKYPISVTLTEDSILFRVHYSTYKTNESYIYDVKKAYSDKSSGTILNHMEEIILKLPYANDSIDDLSNIIHDIYNTRYPLLIGGKTTFIKELIIKRYGYGIESSQDSSTAQKLYDKLRENLDKDFSYSTLWLMDIVKNESVEGNVENKNIYLFDKDGQTVVKFLRKLLLDFMFDLQHSDVFQTSKYYQLMYSGLMSNFYFSALMHKCEYYFYRGLINDAIQKQVSSEETRKIHIKHLYAEKLAQAENLWIQDIMDPRSDKYFEYDIPKNLLGKIKKELHRNTFQNHMSWFAEPEEELRRVCFTMNDIDGVRHICNVDTLVEYLKNKTIKAENDNLKLSRDKNRIVVSRWLLKRYNFSDVVHFHLFKYANIIYFLLSLFAITYIYVEPNAIGTIISTIDKVKDSISIIGGGLSTLHINWCILLLITDFAVALLFVWFSKDSVVELINKKLKIQTIYGARRRIVWKRVIFWGVAQIIAFIAITCVAYSKFYLILLFAFLAYVTKILVPNLHLLYPRLVASIVTAWLTLAAGNDLFAAFFDSKVSLFMTICLVTIVFLFVLYEINRILPLETNLNKIYRSVELIVISYTISLIIGAFIINFTGERLLERAGVLENFYNDYVVHGQEKSMEDEIYTIVLNKDTNEIKGFSEKERVGYLTELEIKKKGDADSYKIATKIDIANKKYTFFILRDFWIQFSFVAMFIGIFIQMIFEEKRITEM